MREDIKPEDVVFALRVIDEEMVLWEEEKGYYMDLIKKGRGKFPEDLPRVRPDMLYADSDYPGNKIEKLKKEKLHMTGLLRSIEGEVAMERDRSEELEATKSRLGVVEDEISLCEAEMDRYMERIQKGEGTLARDLVRIHPDALYTDDNCPQIRINELRDERIHLAARKNAIEGLYKKN